MLARMQKLKPTELSNFLGFKPEVGQEEPKQNKQNSNDAPNTHTHARTHITLLGNQTF